MGVLKTIKQWLGLAQEAVVEGIQWLKARKGFRDFLIRHQAEAAKFILDRVKKGQGLHPIKDDLRQFLIKIADAEIDKTPDNWIEGVIFHVWEHLKATGKV